MDSFTNDRTSGFYERPELFNQLISKSDFALLIKISLNYFDQNNISVFSIEDGVIKANTGNDKGEAVHFGLDNLIKKIVRIKKKLWERAIFEHFDKLRQNHQPAYNYLFKDFEYAAQFLKVVIKDRHFMKPELWEKLVCRVDFPETYTLLILDFEDQFRFLMRDDIKEWDTDEEELFATALFNISKEQVEIIHSDKENDNQLYLFIEPNFAAPFLIDLYRNAPFTIGSLGALIAIPTKGCGLAHPVNDIGIFNVIKAIMPLVVQYYTEHEGSINTHFYWFFEDRFEAFPLHQTEDGKSYLKLPEKLEQLLRKSL